MFKFLCLPFEVISLIPAVSFAVYVIEVKAGILSLIATDSCAVYVIEVKAGLLSLIEAFPSSSIECNGPAWVVRDCLSLSMSTSASSLPINFSSPRMRLDPPPPSLPNVSLWEPSLCTRKSGDSASTFCRVVVVLSFPSLLPVWRLD